MNDFVTYKAILLRAKIRYTVDEEGDDHEVCVECDESGTIMVSTFDKNGHMKKMHAEGHG